MGADLSTNGGCDINVDYAAIGVRVSGKIRIKRYILKSQTKFSGQAIDNNVYEILFDMQLRFRFNGNDPFTITLNDQKTLLNVNYRVNIELLPDSPVNPNSGSSNIIAIVFRYEFPTVEVGLVKMIISFREFSGFPIRITYQNNSYFIINFNKILCTDTFSTGSQFSFPNLT